MRTILGYIMNCVYIPNEQQFTNVKQINYNEFNIVSSFERGHSKKKLAHILKQRWIILGADLKWKLEKAGIKIIEFIMN